jgi:DNA-binding GntR family transcriptional regulator
VTSVDLAPLDTSSLVDRAYQRLRALILSGQLAPRQELRQEVLAGKLGVSRTPLREALNRLASEGLIELRPHRSALVAEFSLHDLEQDYEARRIVEPAAARIAATRRDPEALAALGAALHTEDEAGNDIARRFEASRAFHRALVAAAGNRHLVRFVDELWGGRIAPYFYGRQALMLDRPSRDREEHAEIARLIAAGDPDGAARAVESHLLGALEKLRSARGAEG